MKAALKPMIKFVPGESAHYLVSLALSCGNLDTAAILMVNSFLHQY